MAEDRVELVCNDTLLDPNMDLRYTVLIIIIITNNCVSELSSISSGRVALIWSCTTDPSDNLVNHCSSGGNNLQSEDCQIVHLPVTEEQ